MTRDVTALLAFCEGSHDVAFVRRVLRSCLNFEKVDWRFSEFPSPLNSLFKANVNRHAAQDLSLDMAHKFYLPDHVLRRDIRSHLSGLSNEEELRVRACVLLMTLDGAVGEDGRFYEGLILGEDPRFIARRMVIQSAEDVGNADPMALVIATAAAHAVEYVGLPEAQIPLAQAAIYIACAPKSNASCSAILRANSDVKNKRTPRVPLHLRDTNYPGSKELGHGEGYKYPHDFPGGYVEQEYVEPGTKSRKYYEPKDSGYEAKIKKRMEEIESRKHGISEDTEKVENSNREKGKGRKREKS